MRKYTCIGILLVVSQFVFSSETALKSIPTAAGDKIVPIALNVTQNGHLLSIAKLTSTSSAESVISFYREKWKDPLADSVPGFIENMAGEWMIISRPANGWNQVIQVRDTLDGLEGRVSVLQMEPVYSSDEQKITLPSGAKLVSHTKAEDIGTSSNTYLVFSESGTRYVADFYRRVFEDDGWIHTSERMFMNSKVILLQKRGARAEVVVSRIESGGTLTIINKVIDDK